MTNQPERIEGEYHYAEPYDYPDLSAKIHRKSDGDLVERIYHRDAKERVAELDEQARRFIQQGREEVLAEVDAQGYIDGRRVDYALSHATGICTITLDEIETGDGFDKVPSGRVRLIIATPNQKETGQ